jgi:hypothetical protein
MNAWNSRWKAVGIRLWFSAVLLSGLNVHAQRTTSTAPNLTVMNEWLNITQQTCMGRAGEALRAAGLTPHQPLPQFYGGNNADLFAIITCVNAPSNQVYAHVAVAGAPDRGDTWGTANLLIEFMRAGRRPGGPASTGNLSGEWKTDFGLMTLTQQGTSVTGAYGTSGGRLSGTLSGNVLRFRWEQSNGSGSGRFEFKGNTFDGGWCRCDNPDGMTSNWKGSR